MRNREREHELIVLIYQCRAMAATGRTEQLRYAATELASKYEGELAALVYAADQVNRAIH